MSPFIEKDISQFEKIRIKDDGSATESQDSSTFASPSLPQEGQQGKCPEPMHHEHLSAEEPSFGLGSDTNFSKTFNSSANRPFPRISTPMDLMRHEYDVVVVGSGYGGGVAASRMARGAGEYPSTLKEATPQLHISGHVANNGSGRYFSTGDPTGLYHLVVGEGQNAFVANGLGGTSLLNANVFMPADRKTLASKIWPKEIRDEGLEMYYDRAASVLEPVPYPEDYPALQKLGVLEEQAHRLGLADKFYRVRQTTRFEDGPNSTGVEMCASTLSGMDSTGVNDGSKSSTLVNYLSDAWNWGAEIFCECEVRHIKPHPKGDGYIVFFAWHGSKRRAFNLNFHRDLMWVHAKKFVFLGAGALGTTEILLRSKGAGLKMSDRVGTGMSGNGDILAFGYNTDRTVNAIGRASPVPDLPIGPTITGVIDCRDQDNFLDGFVIEEGAVPESLSKVLQVMLEAMPGRIFPQDFGLRSQLRHMLSRQKSRFLGPYVQSGSVERTQVYLIMSHDDNQAILTLKQDKPSLKFLGVGRSDHVTKLNKVLADATSKIGGTFINNPFYAAFGQKEITVHAIGGANMSSDGSGNAGVTNGKGQLLKGNGKETYDGIVVVDGSIVPLALGANPFATITALAERSIEKTAADAGIVIDYETRNGVIDLFGTPAHPYRNSTVDRSLSRARAIINSGGTGGIMFAEVMEGNIYIGDDIDDFDIAENAGLASGDSLRFFLTCHAWDTDILVSHADHPALLTGSVICGALSRDPFLVHRGKFQLFNQDPRSPDTTNLTYDFDMISTSGEVIHFNGYKIVSPAVAFSPMATWRATSTLYVTLTSSTGMRLGRGLLRIRPAAFLSEALTFTATGSSLFSRLRASHQFLTFFTKQVAKNFFGPLNFLQWPSAYASGYHGDKIPPKEIIQITASDGVRTLMRMWSPMANEQANRPNVFFIPGAAVDHQIFALPTLPCNAVEYFSKAGYNVFVATHRVGKTRIAREGYTTFDARLDVKASLEKIRERQGSDAKVYVVAHCAGSIALSTGLLDGTIPAHWISGITASNVFAHPIFAKINMAKASLPIPLPRIYSALAGSWFSCTSSQNDSLVQRLMNQALRFYPAGGMSEICNSVVCHRSELVFGRLWTHKNLNQSTHANLQTLLGGTSMPSLQRLMNMGVAGYVQNNSGENQVTPAGNVGRLRGIPIFLFSGADNAVYSPEATDVSYNLLRNALDPDDYERCVFQGRGHLDCWIGVGSDVDVYPRVKAHLDRTCLVSAKSDDREIY